MTFAERLRELRKRYGWTQEQVGKEIGVEKTTISNYERGGRMPAQRILMQLAKLFDVTYDYLVGRSDVEHPYDVQAPFPSVLTERLRQRRMAKGYSHQDVGMKLQLAEKQLTNFERGHRAPDLLTLQKLADLYDTTTDYLLGSTDHPNRIFSVRQLRDLLASGRVTLEDGTPLLQEDQDFFVKQWDMFLEQFRSK